ncbi:MAG: hypothetical protein JNJ54_28485 [Myxococcaceae bacterium]|nr:hypothetical protein [Myxococcaceae bacterium]
MKLSLQLQDPQDARAWEFSYLNQFDRAHWVTRCSNSMDTLGGRTCKMRQCPACSLRASRDLAHRIQTVARRMEHRLSLIISLRSTGLWDLRETLRSLRSFVTVVHRWKGLAGLTAVGAIEPKLTAAKRAWVPHAHVVVDAKALVVGPLADRYHDLTNGLGTLMLAAPRPDLFESIPMIATYFSKPESWCPFPGSMHPQMFGIFADAVKGVQRLVEWNGGRRGRRKRRHSEVEAHAA